MKAAYFLPDIALSNTSLTEKAWGWTAEKIFAKIGVAERHVAGPDETALDLAEKACRRLFDGHGVSSGEIDFLVLCTQSSEYRLPSTSCLLQKRLSIPVDSGAITIDHGCSGFVYGLSVAKGLVAGGMARNVLLVTSETYSKYIDEHDLNLRSIFGDGASATLVDGELAAKIGNFHFGTDGGGAEKLIVRDGRLSMDGPEIFAFAMDIAPKTIESVLEKNNLTVGDIDLFVFHQANKYMLETIRKLLDLPEDKFYIHLETTGNTVSSTIPIALCQLNDAGRLRAGMRILLMGFGVGLSWGATVVTV
jgi:3-oxoacyl-[acyl-carrier-protein] synthase-3